MSPGEPAAGGDGGGGDGDGGTGAPVSDGAAQGRAAVRPAAAGAPGSFIVRLSWAGTGLYLVLAAAATAWPATFQAALMAVCVVLFVVGFAAFVAAYFLALGRSREAAIGMGGLYFLSGTAPPAVQRSLVGSFALETVVAVVSASIGLAVMPADADNVLAFGILTPLYGLGLTGLWGARYGTFPPRRPPGTPSAVRAAGAPPPTAGAAEERNDSGDAAGGLA
jgi:hypothetical protein